MPSHPSSIDGCQWTNVVRNLFANALCVFYREFVYSDLPPFKLLDSISYYFLFASLIRFGNFFHLPSSLWARYQKGIKSRTATYIETKYSIHLVYDDFPPDILWRDYFLLDDFKPPRGGTVIDVGATNGEYSILSAKYFGAGKVLCIEPDARSYRFLEGNIKLNDLEGSVFALPLAVWSKDGQVELAESGRYLSERKDESENVGTFPCKTIDTIVSENGLKELDIIKIDTEGGEEEVLKGCLETIAYLEPRVLVEVHSRAHRSNTLGILLPKGYDLVFEKVNYLHPLISVLYLRPKAKSLGVPYRMSSTARSRTDAGESDASKDFEA